MRKILTSLAAAGVLVAGALVAVAIVDSSVSAQEGETDTPTVVRHTELLADALGELVDEGVISQAQADAVRERVQTKAEAHRQEMAERLGELPHFGRRGHGFHFEGFVDPDVFDDGVLDADELAELSEDHPLRDPEGPFAEFLDDGELTLEELREAHGATRFRGFGEFDRFRMPGFIDPEALDDGILDAEELAELFGDNPLFSEDGPLAPLLEGGDFSLEELHDAIREQLGEYRFEFRGPRFRGFGEGFGPFGSDTTPDAESTSA